MKRLRPTVLGPLLMAVVALGVSSPTAMAAAPAGYTPGSPAGSEYQEQLAGAREISVGEGQRPRRDSVSARHATSSPLFGAGITAGGSHRRGGERAAAPRSAGGVAPADRHERSAIATAARAPLDGPSDSLITGLLVLAALVATALLTQLLRRRAAP